MLRPSFRMLVSLRGRGPEAAARPAPLTFAFGLVSALLALLAMQILGTPLLDQGACHIGVALAALVGGLVGVLVRALRDRPGMRNVAWIIVPLAGAGLGMAMQGVLLLRRPEARHYVIERGIDSDSPVAYVLAGAPFGALPAVLAAVLLWGVLRIANRSPALDVRERMLLPLAGTCSLLGALAARAAGDEELPLVFLVVGLATLALIETFLADGARRRLIDAVFAGADSTYALAPLAPASRESVPLLVAGVDPTSVIVRTAGERGYREASHAPFALVADSRALTVAPIEKRQKVLLGILGVTAITLAISLATR